MCSVDACTDLKIEKKLNLTGAVCRKCEDKKAQVVLQGKFPYCRDCFLIYFQHKYSGGIGKAKIMKTGDHVLVAFSGSFSSVCLLNLIHSSLIEDRKKKTKFNVTVIFIDERYNRTVHEREKIYQCIKDIVSNYGYKLFYTILTPFGESVHLSEDPSGLPSVENDKINSMLSQISTKTARADFIERLRTHVLYDVARQLKCNRIFTGETSDHIAVKIIADIAVGRGRQLSSDTNFICDLNEDILLVRPLRECSKKEIIFYNLFNDLYKYHLPSVLEEDTFSSIQKLTESFITELQQSFPSTVSTVVSTGSKLSVGDQNDKKCLMCQCSLDNSKRDLTAEEAMRISQVVTNSGPSGFSCQDFTPLKNIDEMTNICNKEDLPVCYACRINLRESKMPAAILKSLVNGSHQIVERQAMYDEIKDFLF